MAIRQVNTTYVRPEDRILLRVIMTGGEEYRFWLTRAGLRHFAPQMTAWLAPTDDSAASLKQSFQREAAAAQADFATPLQPGENFPLGETPSLVVSLRLESEGAQARLHLHLADQRVVTLHVDEDALSAIQRLLREAIKAADWELPAAPAVATAPGKLH